MLRSLGCGQNFHRSIRTRTTFVTSVEQQISASWKEHQNSYPRPHLKNPAPSASITASCPSFVPPKGESTASFHFIEDAVFDGSLAGHHKECQEDL